jgi:preprotein translocase subunit SecA
LWREHLLTLDHLRQVIHLRGFAQRDPLNEYKSEAFELFDGLIARLRQIVTAQLMRVEVAFEPPPNQLPPMQAHHIDATTGHDEMALALAGDGRGGEMEARVTAAPMNRAAPSRNPRDVSTWGKVGRNEPCPCGSGKKYKHCHGALA